MGYRPLNLVFRFLLEIAALAAMAIWAFDFGGELGRGIVWQVGIGVGTPLAAAAVWGTFATRDDGTRRSNPPVPIPGPLRFVLEAAFFGFAVWCLLAAERMQWGIALAALVGVHYLLSWDRILWLFGMRDKHEIEK